MCTNTDSLGGMALVYLRFLVLILRRRDLRRRQPPCCTDDCMRSFMMRTWLCSRIMFISGLRSTIAVPHMTTITLRIPSCGGQSRA